VASSEPTPAGVSVAAVSAALGASLLLKVLEIVAKRKSFTGDLQRLSLLREAAKNEAERLTQYADEDIAAYRGYMEARRGKATDAELAGSLRGVMETPLNASRSALSGLNLCVEASEIVHGAVAADLATAAILLEGAVRSMLLCVQVNLQHIPDLEVTAECTEIEEKAFLQLASVLRQVAIRSARA
jgi:formiminotetrahydrofolate cyclodeaminase